ncbi:MAG: hypothetical protein LBR64_03570 [Dysgonamonadaceae bacterium]|nr:hypothetical protein [Dysgonamonadaceae bacterium]
MLDFDNIFDLPEGDEPEEEEYPDFYYEWDEAVTAGGKPRFYDQDELLEIIEIYVSNREMEKANQAIDYAITFYPSDEDLPYDILEILSDYEMWNDLLTACAKTKEQTGVWSGIYRLIALLHLGMEEEAFQSFRSLKIKYIKDKDSLTDIYQCMAEALMDIDLYDSAVKVIEEGVKLHGGNSDDDWLLMRAYVSTFNKEKVKRQADRILKKMPLDGESWLALGDAFFETGIWDRTIEAYENAHSLGVYTQQSKVHLVFCYEIEKSIDKAYERAIEFLAENPDSYLFIIIAAKICSDAERWEEAIQHIDKALELSPGLNVLYFYKSFFLQNLEEYKKAKMVLMQGIEFTEDPEGSLARELEKLNEQFPDIKL